MIHKAQGKGEVFGAPERLWPTIFRETMPVAGNAALHRADLPFREVKRPLPQEQGGGSKEPAPLWGRELPVSPATLVMLVGCLRLLCLNTNPLCFQVKMFCS